MKNILPYLPYDERYILVPIDDATRAGFIKPAIQPGRGINMAPTVDSKSTKYVWDDLVNTFNDLATKMRTYDANVGKPSGTDDPGPRGLDRDADFGENTPANDAATADTTSYVSLAERNLEAGIKKACQILKDKTSPKEQLLAAFYYQLGAMGAKGLTTVVDPAEVLTVPQNITRACGDRGACQDVGDKLDKLFEKMSSGRGGEFRELGDWADKIRDCIRG